MLAGLAQATTPRAGSLCGWEPAPAGAKLPTAQTVKPEACSSFDAFLSVKKSMRSLLCQRRKKCAFLTEEKSTKRLIEASASNSHPSAGKHIPTAPNSCLLSLRSASQHSPCGEHLPLETRARRRKATGLHSLPVRRVPPWIARVYRVQTRVGSR